MLRRQHTTDPIIRVHVVTHPEPLRTQRRKPYPVCLQSWIHEKAWLPKSQTPSHRHPRGWRSFRPWMFLPPHWTADCSLWTRTFGEGKGNITQIPEDNNVRHLRITYPIICLFQNIVFKILRREKELGIRYLPLLTSYVLFLGKDNNKS